MAKKIVKQEGISAKDFLNAVDILEKERGIDRNSVIEALKEALEKAYKKNLADNEAKVNSNIRIGNTTYVAPVVGRPLTKEEATSIQFSKEYSPEDNIEVVIDSDKGDIKIYDKKIIVDNLDDDDESDTWINEDVEEFLAYAQEVDPNYQIGDIFVTDVNMDNFGRLAAIHAKQVVKQKIREIEKDIIYSAYADFKDDIIVGTIDRVEPSFAIVELRQGAKPTMGYLPAANQIPNERLYVGNKLKAYVVEVDKEAKGAQVILSRAEPNFIKRLFEESVTEVYNGDVVIKAIAREAGDRTKVAVYTSKPGIDPVGTLIGVKGANIQRVQNEIGDERIDVIKYDEDMEQFITNTLAPAEVLSVKYNPETKEAQVIVEDDQLSLAIGKRGQNVRLAVRLTNAAKIDIIPESKAIEQGIEITPKVVEEAPVEKPVVNKPIDIKLEPAGEKPTRKKKVKEVPVYEEPIYLDEDEDDEEDTGPVLDLETLLKDIKEATPKKDIKIKKDTKRSKPKEEVEEVTFLDEEKPTEKPVVPIYTEEELEEIRKQEEEEKRLSEDYYDDVDYDEYDDYYDYD